MRRQTTVAISILLIAITIPVLWAGAIDWIQYNERLSGEDSPFYEDIINRPAKQIYAIYTSEHHPDGTHKTFPVPDFPTPIPTVPFPTPLPTVPFPTPLPTPTPQPTPTPVNLSSYTSMSTFEVEHYTNGTHKPIPGIYSAYALQGAAAAPLAFGTFAENSQLENPQFSTYGVVWLSTLAYAEKFYSRINTHYSQTRFSFGKTADNKLVVALGPNVYTSAAAVFTADNLGVPIEIGVICDRTANTVTFFHEGKVGSAISVDFSGIPPNDGYNEVYNLGDGMIGGMFFWSFSKSAIFAANTYHTPLREGLSQCPACVWHYNMNEGSGSTLLDRYAESRNVSGFNLIKDVSTTWQIWTQGY